MKKLFLLLVCIVILSHSNYVLAVDIRVREYPMPRNTEHYIIPSFHLYLISDEKEWKNIVCHYTGQVDSRTLCGIFTRDKRTKKTIIYLPKTGAIVNLRTLEVTIGKIHTETLGHEVIHLLLSEYPTAPYDPDREVGIIPRECK